MVLLTTQVKRERLQQFRSLHTDKGYLIDPLPLDYTLAAPWVGYPGRPYTSTYVSLFLSCGHYLYVGLKSTFLRSSFEISRLFRRYSPSHKL